MFNGIWSILVGLLIEAGQLAIGALLALAITWALATAGGASAHQVVGWLLRMIVSVRTSRVTSLEVNLATLTGSNRATALVNAGRFLKTVSQLRAACIPSRIRNSKRPRSRCTGEPHSMS